MKDLKNIDRTTVALQKSHIIFINENLTPTNNKIAFHCRELERNGRIDKTILEMVQRKSPVQILKLEKLDDKFMINFCELNDLSSLIDKPTCYKNFDKPKCIDLILTNKPSYFQHSNVFETGLSDFHLLTVTEFKMGFQKLKPQVITYRSYKNLIMIDFRWT